MSVQTCVAMTVGGTLISYDVRSITRGKAAANVPYVSSLTDGKTHRVEGNMDATWEISLYANLGMYEIPAVLMAGQTITIETPVLLISIILSKTSFIAFGANPREGSSSKSNSGS